MSTPNAATLSETPKVFPLDGKNFSIPVGLDVATTKASTAKDQKREIHPKRVIDVQRPRSTHQSCEECQNPDAENILICAVCEYVAIYGRKPYALLLHEPIKKFGDDFCKRTGVPRAQLEKEMPRAALEYLLTGRKSKNSRYPMDSGEDYSSSTMQSSAVALPDNTQLMTAINVALVSGDPAMRLALLAELCGSSQENPTRSAAIVGKITELFTAYDKLEGKPSIDVAISLWDSSNLSPFFDMLRAGLQDKENADASSALSNRTELAALFDKLPRAARRRLDRGLSGGPIPPGMDRKTFQNMVKMMRADIDTTIADAMPEDSPTESKLRARKKGKGIPTVCF